MRHKIHAQTSLVEPSINHEHAQELQQMGAIIASCPQLLQLVHADLIRGLKDPKKGRNGLMTAEQIFKVLLIKQMNGFSYTVLRFHLQDSRTYRNFCSFGIADKIPSRSTIQRDIKRLRPKNLEDINRLIIRKAAADGIEKGRKVRIDCTVIDANIHHPTDSSLLWDCVRVLCRLTQQAKQTFGYAVSDHRRRAKRRALAILNAKNKQVRRENYLDLLKVTKKMVANAKRTVISLKKVSHDILAAIALTDGLERYIPLAETIITQTERRVLKGEKLSPAEKLVSIFEPHTNIIVKDRRETYYGHKVAITGGVSGLLTDLVIEEGNPSDTTLAKKMIERQRPIFGRVPRQAAFDGGFASKSNLKSIKDLGVKDVAFSKKCGLKISEMTKSTWVYKRLRNFRAGIEGMISFLKRSMGFSRCTWSGFQSFKAYAWSSVITANLLLMARRMPA